MKGIVFTELLEMVESTLGDDVATGLLDDPSLPSGGAYTAVGTYAFSELETIVTNLARVTGREVPEVLRGYGRHLFGRFVALYPRYFEGANSAFDLLERVDGFIHVEVKKLYPDADPPRFDCRRDGDRAMDMTYRSRRPLADFAVGLIEGCVAHYGEPIEVARRDITRGGDETVVEFELRRT